MVFLGNGHDSTPSKGLNSGLADAKISSGSVMCGNGVFRILITVLAFLLPLPCICLLPFCSFLHFLTMAMLPWRVFLRGLVQAPLASQYLIYLSSPAVLRVYDTFQSAQFGP